MVMDISLGRAQDWSRKKRVSESASVGRPRSLPTRHREKVSSCDSSNSSSSSYLSFIFHCPHFPLWSLSSLVLPKFKKKRKHERKNARGVPRRTAHERTPTKGEKKLLRVSAFAEVNGGGRWIIARRIASLNAALRRGVHANTKRVTDNLGKGSFAEASLFAGCSSLSVEASAVS
jgi:hypothetical protein